MTFGSTNNCLWRWTIVINEMMKPVFFRSINIEISSRMALTNPMPMGPWKASKCLITLMKTSWHTNVISTEHVVSVNACSSQFTIKRISKASAWSSPPPVRTSWNVAWTIFALWKWSVERKSRTHTPLLFLFTFPRTNLFTLLDYKLHMI